jgi:hypothetical protein
MEMLGFGGLRGKTVKGAPFSATATTETTQTLGDGTSIHRSHTANLFRDSQGRSREELTLSGFGPLAASGKTHSVVTINDPVTQAHFMLDADHKVAHKMALRTHDGAANPEGAQEFQQKMQARMQKERTAEGVNTQSLGTQSINGVSAEGTRVTRTIPAGQIGNDKPLQVVFERWYSPDLQMVVKSSRTDPRFGITTYTLNNIQRTEPAATLFTVPSDFTVKEGGRGARGMGRRGGPAPAAQPAPTAPSN